MKFVGCEGFSCRETLIMAPMRPKGKQRNKLREENNSLKLQENRKFECFESCLMFWNYVIKQKKNDKFTAIL